MNSTRPFVHLGMKHFLTGFLFLLLISNFNRLYAQKDALYKMVNPFIGTGGHGHTFPGAVMPFGACQLSPDTRLEGWDGCGGYHDSDSVIYGFSHTHLSGTGCRLFRPFPWINTNTLHDFRISLKKHMQAITRCF
jgi:putative alpha-1,2-mannosidase